MDAYELSTPIHGESSYCFGMDNSGVVKSLRTLADQLEKGDIALQSARVLTTAKNDEFATTMLRILFSEKRQSKAKILEDALKQVSAYLGEPTKPPYDFMENIEYAKQLGGRNEEIKNLYGTEQFPVATAVVRNED